jgi:hypothetical protein
MLPLQPVAIGVELTLGKVVAGICIGEVVATALGETLSEARKRAFRSDQQTVG